MEIPKPPIKLPPGDVAGLTNSPDAGRLFDVVAWFGFPPRSWIVPPAVVGAWILSNRPREGAWQLAAWSGTLASPLIRRIVARRRPPAPLWRSAHKPSGQSFPSSHTLTYTAFYGMTAYLAARASGPLGIRLAAATGALTLVGLIGPARLYHREHWVSDVVAGYIFGALIFAATAAGYEVMTRGGLRNQR